MHRRLRTCISRAAVGLALAGLTSGLLASPMISVDNADVNIGTIIEGKQKMVEHVFKIKNTGDSVLVIKQVRPG